MPPERRTAHRYPLQLTLEFDDVRAVTRDVSVGGVYFETGEPLAPETPFRFALIFENGRLLCDGRIVRVEWRDGQLGVAAAVASSRFEVKPPEAPPP